MVRRNVLLHLWWYHPHLHRGVARFARQHHWHLTSDTTFYSGRYISSWRGDGIISQVPMDSVQANALRCGTAPMVLLGRVPGFGFHGHVSDDSETIGKLAAAHLMECGFRRFAVYGRLRADTRLHPRLAAFRSIVASHGFACTDLRVMQEGEPDWRRQLLDLAAGLRRCGQPLGVFGIDDDSAGDVIEACSDSGLAVPESVAVLGVRNDELVCEALGVPLSSVDQDLEGVGYRAAELLAAVMAGEELPEKTIIVPPKGVVIRKSTEVTAVEHPQVAKALAFIKRNCHLPMAVADVAQGTALSERGLYKAFKTHLGYGPSHEILRQRLAHARQLLADGNDKLSVVARESGFADRRALHAAFRRELGTTPRAYRMKQRAETAN